MKTKLLLTIVIIIAAAAIAVGIITATTQNKNANQNTTNQNVNVVTNKASNSNTDGTGGGGPAISFADCASLGYPIMESYPRKCTIPDGQVFTEDIGNELEKADLIKITSPRPNAVITSPVTITGEARGTWFFEGEFPIELKDIEGKTISTAITSAQGEWMTENFVAFKATLTFSEKAYGPGKLYLNKSNPSDNPELDDQLIVPVDFKVK